MLRQFLMVPLFVFSSAWADSPREAGIQVSIEKTIQIEDHDLGTLVNKELDLGLFRPGTTVNLALKVENTSRKSFGFDRVRSGATAFKISPDRAKLDPSESVDFHIEIEVPSEPVREFQEATFWVAKGAAIQFSVRVRYSWSGVVGFKDSTIRIGIPEGKESETVSIPFFADALSPAEFVEVEMAEKLFALESTLDYEKKLVWLNVPASSLENGKLSGQMFIRNIETNAQDQITIDIYSDRKSEVYPSIIRFVREDELRENRGNENGSPRFAASVVVRCKDILKDSKVHAEFFVDGNPIEIDSNRVRNGVAIYKIVLDSERLIEAAMKKEARIDCSVIVGTAKDLHRLPIAFQVK